MSKLTISEFRALLDELEKYIDKTLEAINISFDEKFYFRYSYSIDKAILIYKETREGEKNADVTNYVKTYLPKEVLNQLKVCNEALRYLYMVYIKPIGIDSSSALEINKNYQSEKPYFKIRDNEKLLEGPNGKVKIRLKGNYLDIYNQAPKKLIHILKKLNNKEAKVIFDMYGIPLNKHKGKDLSKYDLSEIDFKDKNISELDLSHNINNISLNLNQIQKTLYKTNIQGYDGKGYILRDFDIRDANLQDTNLGIDILTCMISYPEKLKKGTEFDENNEFYIGNKKLTIEEAKTLGLNIKEKVKTK